MKEDYSYSDEEFNILFTADEYDVYKATLDQLEILDFIQDKDDSDLWTKSFDETEGTIDLEIFFINPFQVEVITRFDGKTRCTIDSIIDFYQDLCEGHYDY